MKKSLEQQLKEYFQYKGGEWTSKAALMREMFIKNRFRNTYYSPATVCRTAQKMAEEGTLIVQYNHSNHASYRIPDGKRKRRIIGYRNEVRDGERVAVAIYD